MENNKGIITTYSGSGSEKLMVFFTSKLNKLHCAKSHLVERFQEISTENDYFSLPFSIDDTIAVAEKTLERINTVYDLIGEIICYDGCAELINVLEEAFSAIRTNLDDATLCCLNTICYLKKIEKTQSNAYELMTLTATLLNNQKLLGILSLIFEDGENSLALQLTDMVLTDYR